MTEQEKIKKAIRHFECMRDDAQVVLDTGFGTHEGETSIVYDNRKMYAELAISALEKQMPKKPELKLGIYFCSECGNSFNDDMNENYCNCCGQAIDWSEDNDK